MVGDNADTVYLANAPSGGTIDLAADTASTGDGSDSFALERLSPEAVAAALGGAPIQLSPGVRLVLLETSGASRASIVFATR